MKLEKFMALAAPERYDFSNDGANSAYQALDNKADGLEKFFGYMAANRAYEQEEENIMKRGSDYCMKCKERFHKIPDPDSGSELLQKIYSLLWEEPNLQYCRRGKERIIQGDTMNSANTTLIALYKLLETPEHKKEREAIKTEKGGNQNVSIRYILSRYAQDAQRLTQQLDEIEGMRHFVSIYHTVGNFIPVPARCNAPRGQGAFKDYWDLTLKAIYGYYLGDSPFGDRIKDIAGEQNSKRYKEWLDSFNSWECFVEKNYLQDFVNYGSYPHYGEPKELWKGHFSGETLPNKKEDIEQYYVNASAFIMARSIRMQQKLRNV